MANPITPIIPITSSSSSSPIVVGFGSIPGGTGCTTLAAHAAACAARLGLHTLGVSVDRNGDLLRRLGNDAEYIDGHWNQGKRLKLAHCPPELLVEVGVDNLLEYLPNLGFGETIGNPEIIIVDLGPAVATQLPLSADFWVIPIMDSRSIRSLLEQTYPRGKVATLFLRTQVSFGTPKREEIIRLQSQQPTEATARLMQTEIPRSGLLRQAEWEGKTVWELGTQASLTRKRMDAFCNELLGIVATNLLTAAVARLDSARPVSAQNPSQSTRTSAPAAARYASSHPDPVEGNADDDLDEDDDCHEDDQSRSVLAQWGQRPSRVAPSAGQSKQSVRSAIETLIAKNAGFIGQEERKGPPQHGSASPRARAVPVSSPRKKKTS